MPVLFRLYLCITHKTFTAAIPLSSVTVWSDADTSRRVSSLVPLPRFDTSEWTQVSDRREDRKDYSDWTDEDTGFSEVIALESKTAPASNVSVVSGFVSIVVPPLALFWTKFCSKKQSCDLYWRLRIAVIAIVAGFERFAVIGDSADVGNAVHVVRDDSSLMLLEVPLMA